MATIRLFRHYIPMAYVLLGVLEAFAFILAFYAGVEIRFWNADQATVEKVLPILPKALVFAAALILSMGAMGLYQRHTRDGFEGLLLRTLAAFALSLLPLSLMFYFAPGLYLGRGALALAYLLSLVAVALLRAVFLRVSDQSLLKRRVLVLGTGKKAAMIRGYRRASDMPGLNILGYVRMGDKDEKIDAEAIIDLDRPLPEFVRDHDVDELVVAVDDRRRRLPVQELLDCKMAGIEVVDLLSFFEREMGEVKLDILDPSWLFLSDGFQRGALRAYSKRLFDVTVTLLMMPFMLPLMGLVALAVYLESGCRGPVLYYQTRVGENGKPFRIIKFRSMSVDAEKNGAQWASQGDSRITRVGHVIRKVRLDELPQLFNILKGDMSFVGPRPERPEFVEGLEKKIPYYGERHRVKPGLTGWAQISYQYGASDEDAFRKHQYDLYYVKNYSLLLDLLILVQTAEVVLMGKGAH